jgi:hypothetical protein
MPNAYDRQRLTITHSPVEKVDTAFGKLPDLFSPEQILEQVKTFVTELLFPAIEELTGIDLGRSYRPSKPSSTPSQPCSGISTPRRGRSTRWTRSPHSLS